MKILIFIICFIPFIISSFSYKFDLVYYNSLYKPFFTLPNVYFNIIWIIIFILLSISITKYYYNQKYNRDFTYVLLSNYFSIYLYIYSFFTLKSPLISFVCSIFTLVSSYSLFKEIKKISNKSSLLVLPYNIFLIYLTILSGFVCFMNL